MEEMAAITERRLLEEGLVRQGDLVGIVAGTPLGVGGTTNFMKFHVVGGGRAGMAARARRQNAERFLAALGMHNVILGMRNLANA